MKGSGLTEDREKGQERWLEKAGDLNSKQGNQKGKKEERKRAQVSMISRHKWKSHSRRFFFFLIKDAQCVNSVPAPYLCYGTHTYSNPMTNAADNSITEDFNRGYLGDSQRAKVA